METCILPESANDTLLVLIPKLKHPKKITQLSQINLCNVGYKVITKTLTNKLKEIMTTVVASNHNSFVPGIHIANNIILYQEALHSIRQQRKGKNFMLIKVDLEKAYDRL